ncbi:hypothetical protein AB5I41_20405 [Sphingomonas sp. MMS24-JH45]
MGARLISFVGHNCRNDWRMSRLEHLPAIALERRLAYTDDQWSMAGGQLLTTRYAAAGGFSHHPTQLVTPERCRGEWWRPVNYARSPASRACPAFDDVRLIRPPRPSALRPRPEAGMALAALGFDAAAHRPLSAAARRERRGPGHPRLYRRVHEAAARAVICEGAIAP